jgi:small subunit ribosomal protein S1
VLMLDKAPSLANTQSLQDDFAALLEQSFETEAKPGSVVIGEVIRVDKDGLLVDIGGKSEGYVVHRELPNYPTPEEVAETYTKGQVREFFVLRSLDERGTGSRDEMLYPLSIRRVAAVKSWEVLADMKEAGTSVEVTVTGITKGGILVNIMDLKGFIPASQLRVAKTHQELMGEVLPTKILEVDKQKNKLILSHRAAVFEQKAMLRSETLTRLAEGEVVEGDIVKVTDFGVFVDIYGIDGLLPLSEISWQRLRHPSEALELGQRVKVQVLTVDQQQQRISLSLKRLQSDPWETVDSKFSIGDMLTGQVTRMLTSGVLIELMPGVEAYSVFEQGGKFYQLGEFCEFEIVSIASQDRRMTLAYRGDASQPNVEALPEGVALDAPMLLDKAEMLPSDDELADAPDAMDMDELPDLVSVG